MDETILNVCMQIRTLTLNRSRTLESPGLNRGIGPRDVRVTVTVLPTALADLICTQTRGYIR